MGARALRPPHGALTHQARGIPRVEEEITQTEKIVVGDPTASDRLDIGEVESAPRQVSHLHKRNTLALVLSSLCCSKTAIAH